MAIFSTFLFWQYMPGKCLLRYSRTNTPRQAIKTRSSKSRKIDIFPKRLTHGFGRKKALFLNFFFQKIQARKVSFTIFQNEKTPFQPIKTRKSKRRKIDIFKKRVNPWFWSKNVHFLNSFYQALYARKMSFTIFQNEKPPIQAMKTRSSKRRKIDIFPKGLTHGFGLKNGHFSTFSFKAIQAGKMSFTIFQNKKRFSKL